MDTILFQSNLYLEVEMVWVTRYWVKYGLKSERC